MSLPESRAFCPKNYIISLAGLQLKGSITRKLNICDRKSAGAKWSGCTKGRWNLSCKQPWFRAKFSVDVRSCRQTPHVLFHFRLDCSISHLYSWRFNEVFNVTQRLNLFPTMHWKWLVQETFLCPTIGKALLASGQPIPRRHKVVILPSVSLVSFCTILKASAK